MHGEPRGTTSSQVKSPITVVDARLEDRVRQRMGLPKRTTFPSGSLTEPSRFP